MDMLIAQVWPGAEGLFLPAADGAWAMRNSDLQGGKGGVILLYAPWVKRHIHQSGMLPLQAGIWITLKGQHNLDMGVADVYAPNSPALRTRIWNTLATSLDAAFKWTLLGDLNMTLEPEDQFGGIGLPIAGEEKTAWNLLQGTLQLKDTFVPTTGKILFSWDNKRKVLLQDDRLSQDSLDLTDPTLTEGRVLKRLDRIYANEQLLSKPYNCVILPRFMLSDHLPVVTSLQLGNITYSGATHFRLNTDLLRDPKLQEKIKIEWLQIERWHLQNRSTPERLLKACIRRTVIICRHWGKIKAEKKRQEVAEIRLNILNLSCHLQYNPQCMNTQIQLHHEQLKLQAIELQKAKWVESLLDRKWAKEGDRCTKTFFPALKARKEKTAIHELINDQGTSLTEEEDKAEWAKTFFARLLQKAPEEPGELQATEFILAACTTKVDDDQRAQLEKEYTLTELHQAALQLVGPALLRLATDGLQNSKFPPYFTAGDIVLIPKVGDQAQLHNKRPIILLNAAYKIVAKLLQNRMTPVLQSIITWEQNVFIQGRTIHATLFLCNEAVWEAKNQGQDSTLLKVDFRKTFDTLSWEFLFKTMATMQFGEQFINCIKALTSTASSTVIVNKTRSGKVNVGRSVRQDCPISPLLFTLATQAWTDYVNSLQSRQQLKGINLPHAGITYIQGHFADDIHLMLRAEPGNLLNAKNAIALFGKASGLNVQWNKSLATDFKHTQTCMDRSFRMEVDSMSGAA
ncbi:hypothetical protein R1sor_009975 [Riccia sorocarpa]|uniref:Reverse transcriptase domain-containing protein n=1 Tax=Riccia sorocarpa TaxID=122646 RepID=A0ABD3I2Q4_9MARC